MPRTRAQRSKTTAQPEPVTNVRPLVVAPVPEEELEVDKSLHLVGGCYGVWESNKGFLKLTNFRMEPVGFIRSKKFILFIFDELFGSEGKMQVFCVLNWIDLLVKCS